jgi:hypothetical protein
VKPRFQKSISNASTFGQLRRGDLSEHITHESVTTPSEWKEKFNIKHGAVFGLSHGGALHVESS